jgi:hypothetical protein
MKCVCGYEGRGFLEFEFNKIKMIHGNCEECNIKKPCGNNCGQIVRKKEFYVCPKCGTLKLFFEKS